MPQYFAQQVSNQESKNPEALKDDVSVKSSVSGRDGNRILYVRYLFALAFICLMVLVSELSGQSEIIFPETLAVLTGMWVVRRPPWHVSRLRLVLLLTSAAFFGYFLVVFVDIPMYAKYMIGFTFCMVLLKLSRCTVWPILSACILPILLHSDSVVYPISVFVMMTLVCLGQYLMERAGMHEKTHFTPTDKPNAKSWLKLALRIGLFAILAAPAFITQQYYLVVPPLIVAYAGFTERGNILHKHWLKTIVLFAIVATLATAIRYYLNLKWGLSLTLCGALSTCVLFVLFELFNIHLPPVGAAALLPLVINTQTLWLYPIELTVGAFVFIGIPHLLFSYLPDRHAAKQTLK